MQQPSNETHGHVVVQPMLYGELPDVFETPPLSDADFACLAEIRAVLSKHACIDRFGVSLLHRHFDLADDEIIVESTDVGARVMTSRVQKVTEKPTAAIAIETQWRFSRDNATVICHGYCHYDRGHGHYHQRK